MDWKKIVQVTYLIRDEYQEYKKNYYNSRTKKKSKLKMGKGLEETFL